MKQDRNELCHCGSGKKYKNCHGRKSLAASLSGNATFGIVAFVLVVGGIILFSGPLKENQPAGQSAPVRPGVTPPGKVWSEEHGHWHDAPGTTPAASSPAQQPGATSSQPSGPAPDGKVWSPEHGHWHDAPGSQSSATQTGTTLYPQPDGPVPEGKVWSPQHGHWHDAPPKQ